MNGPRVILTLTVDCGLPYQPTAAQIVQMDISMTAEQQRDGLQTALATAWGELKTGMAEDRDRLLVQA